MEPQAIHAILTQEAGRVNLPKFYTRDLNGYCDDDRSFKVNPEQEPTQARSLADVAEDVG